MAECTPMRIALGSDHAGLPLKERVETLLEELGHEAVDFGCFTAERCDYPDYCRPVAEAVRNGECLRCIVFGGSGNGEAIVANRVPGVRAPLCWSQETARLGRDTTTPIPFQLVDDRVVTLPGLMGVTLKTACK